VRTVGRIALLVGLWLLAWGEVSLANLVSGVAVATALLVAFPPGPRASGRRGFSPVGAGRLAVYVLVHLVKSNVVMAREIVRRRPDAHPGVLAHRLGQPSEEVVTVMTSVIALSPGTMTVDVDSESRMIYVHFFLLRDPEAARTSLSRLEELAVHAVAAQSRIRPARTATKEPS
jgi:multicomponent Na+:H+ antiporter subunit E